MIAALVSIAALLVGLGLLGSPGKRVRRPPRAPITAASLIVASLRWLC